MAGSTLTTKDSTPQILRYADARGLERVSADPDTLVKYAFEALRFGEHSLFEMLPAAIDRLIEMEAWRRRDPPLRDFGQMALHPSGLGIRDDRGLALLRAAMDVKGRHIEPWTDVLAEVDAVVKAVAAETGKSLTYIRAHPEEFSDQLTYAPGGGAFDRRILDLRRTDKVTFRQVVKGKKPLREALPPRKRAADRLAALKSAWKGSDAEERRQFRNWLDHEAEK